MATKTQRMNLPGGIQLDGTAAKVGRFLWHYLQMAIAMEMGMLIYHLFLSPLLEQTAYGPLTDAYPIIGYWGMVVSMVLGMLALMLYQRSTVRYCAEMTGVMVAPVAALTVLVLCSFVTGHILYATGDPLMFLAMAAYMLYRPHEHAHGAHRHAAQEHTGSPEDEWSEKSGGHSCH